MNKSELIGQVAEKTGMTRTGAGLAVDAVFGAIEKELTAGGDFQLTGFGKFFVKETREKKGRNPATGEELMIAAKKVPKFKPGVSLKTAVAG